MVLPRLLTALIGAPLILATIWCGSLPYLVLTMGVVFLGLWEFYTLSELGGYPAQRWPGIVLGLLLVLSLFVSGSPTGGVHQKPGTPFLLSLSLLVCFGFEFPRRDKGHSFLRISTTLLGLLFVAWPLGHLTLLRDLQMEGPARTAGVGRDLSYLILLCLWAQDIMAWMVGNWIGRRRLASLISPRKTWEGALGGWLGGMGVGVLFRELFLKSVLGRGETLFICAGLGVLAQVSDLAASFVKRSLGAKDFSGLLPGHGGVLDRFDSFLFTVPFFYYYLIGMGRFQ